MDNELNIDNLNGVSGGTSPLFPEQEKQAVNRPYDLSTQMPAVSATPLPEIFANCKLCGNQVMYLGQIREGGGNTGEYKCTNPMCDNFEKILYNDGVDIL